MDPQAPEEQAAVQRGTTEEAEVRNLTATTLAAVSAFTEKELQEQVARLAQATTRKPVLEETQPILLLRLSLLLTVVAVQGLVGQQVAAQSALFGPERAGASHQRTQGICDGTVYSD